MEQCNGEKCKDCKYCQLKKSRIYEDIVTAKWRFGLSIAVGVVALLSIGVDIFMICKFC